MTTPRLTEKQIEYLFKALHQEQTASDLMKHMGKACPAGIAASLEKHGFVITTTSRQGTRGARYTLTSIHLLPRGRELAAALLAAFTFHAE